LPLLPPLRTVRASFPAHGSSIRQLLSSDSLPTLGGHAAVRVNKSQVGWSIPTRVTGRPHSLCK